MGGVTSRHENFFSQQPRDVHICSQEEAIDILAKAEHVDNYRSACAACSLNARARRDQDYSPRTSSANIVPYLAAIEQFPNWLKDYLPPVLYIIFLASSADGGMPHTRQPNVICLPQYFNIETPQGRETFMHECIHVHQRTYPQLWDRIYFDIFHLEPYSDHRVAHPVLSRASGSGDTLPDSLERRRRYNPDTFNAPYYMWRGRWVAVPIFTNQDRPTLSAIKIAYYNVKSGAWQSFMPPEMEAFFGPGLSIAQAEHPNELVAYWLASPPNSANKLQRALITHIEELSSDEYY